AVENAVRAEARPKPFVVRLSNHERLTEDIPINCVHPSRASGRTGHDESLRASEKTHSFALNPGGGCSFGDFNGSTPFVSSAAADSGRTPWPASISPGISVCEPSFC